MELKPFPIEFQKALPILERIQNAGFEAYFVGGCVRDCLLHQKIHDVDIATSATPLEVAALFSKTFDLGIQHGTIAVLENHETYEITTFRTESGYEDFRRPSEVHFVRSLEEDLKRRDFTINALAVATDGRLIDLYGGLEDLKRHVIQAVGNPHERFLEDALRMMRGVRFAAQLGFTLENETFLAMKELAPLLEKIAVERIRVEFEKLLLGKFASGGFELFLQSGLFQHCPQLKEQKLALEDFQQKLHTTSLVLPEVSLAWTLLFDSLALKNTSPTFFLKSWKLANDTISEVEKLMTYLPLRKQGFLELWEIYQLGLPLAEKLEDLLPFYGKIPEKKRLVALFESLPIKNRQELHLTGSDVLAYFEKKAGPWVGESLLFAEKQVVLGLLPNDTAVLLSQIQEEFSWNKFLS